MVNVDSPTANRGYPPAARAWGVTLLLTIIYVFSFVDRQVLNLLVGPIQQDLSFTDTQISLLQGFGFVATYVLLSVPIGRLVDTRRRVNIIAAGVAFWSVATAACGMVRSFPGLFMARAGVGIGEAALTPAAWSLIADLFPSSRRSFPLSVFLMGPYLGVGVAMIAGGLVMDELLVKGDVVVPLLGAMAPWQLTFLTVAAPGLLLTVLMLLIREPLRQGVDAGPMAAAATGAEISFWLRSNARVYVALLLGVPCIVLVLYALQAWVPSYLQRVQGMSLGEAGTRYGSVALVAGSLGVLSGPFFGRLLEQRGFHDYPIRIGAITLGTTVPALLALAVAPTPTLALAAIGFVSFLVTVPLALAASALQIATPNRMRGVLAGAYVVATNLIGMAIGPSLVALTTDYLFGDPAAIGQSLALVGTLAALVGVTLLVRGLKPYADLVATLADDH